MDQVEATSGNVYEDLGLAGAGQMLVKAQLAGRIGSIVKARHLTQSEAAQLLGIPQPKVSQMLRGNFRGISEVKMIECLTSLGCDVQIVVKAAREPFETGRVEVVIL